MENQLILIVLGSVLAVLVLGFTGAPLWAWTILVAGLLFYAQVPVWLWAVFGVIAAVFNLPFVRRTLISAPLMKTMKSLGIIPQISETERVALNSGDVWIEGELFSGKPNLQRLLDEKYPQLTAEEKAFCDGPVDELCSMVTDWDIWQKRDLPPQAWEFLKKHKFLGMIIPKEYGGLGFSAMAHSEVIMKMSTRSVPLAITAMVPNSLGPAELLNHYGTEEQKKYYLPRLARGEEVPCFALTEPMAGSDAASLSANGVVFKGTDGKLHLKLNWNKRYITLAAISTVLGLAFRLRDPENLLGKGEDVGITCALIPTKALGVTADRRHDPLGVPFFNCPTQGKDVVVPIDAIIGGPAMAGQGWKMLMESLAAGRGISLPAQATAAAKYVARISSAHATVRKQFGMSVGKFEGIQEPLAQLGGWCYLLEAARRYTLGAIDGGSKPPVITAIAKYYFTELQRKIVNYGMDIVGGQGISRGPRNLIAHGYISAPISVTVEGANILTRTLIIFGQGALRAHPFAFKEVEAIETNNLDQFDRAFFGHVGFVIRNTFRSTLLGLTRGYLIISPVGGGMGRYYQKLSWASSSFALLADLAMAGLGAKLKTRGRITGRFADILGHMYLATAVLRRFEAEGRRKEDLPFVHWSLQYAFANIQIAFDGLLANFEVPGLSWLFRGPIRWLTLANPIGRMPNDALDSSVASLIQKNSEQRDRFTDGIYLPKDPNEQMRRLETAFALTLESEAVFSKVRKAMKAKIIKKAPAAQLYKEAVDKNVITPSEFEIIAKAEAARTDAVQVDDFGLIEYANQNTGADVGTAHKQPVLRV